MSEKKVVVIGAGIGGLTAAAALARAGLDVTVLEAHVYAGGCAGTFFHQGYRFDAGATLAGGFYPGGPMDLVAQAAGISSWPARRSDPAMQVHLPDGSTVTRFGGPERHTERRRAFGAQGLRFFDWQERSADALWDFALRGPDWPPQTPGQLARLLGTGVRWGLQRPGLHLSPSLLADALRPASAHLGNASERLRLFVDAQLLISAQTTSEHANAMYAASALDLPRRGVVHLRGGMGAIADTLVSAVRAAGGQVLFRRQVKAIRRENGRPAAVVDKYGKEYPADAVIANLTPAAIDRLLGEREGVSSGDAGWGAFMLYAGIDESLLPADFPLHHQVVAERPLGEGNSVFISISPGWDNERAPQGRRAVTISTHTDLAPWWSLFEQDRSAYERRKHAYQDRILDRLEGLLPGFRQAADTLLPGTPVTFQRFTRRPRGWVGGFPQTSLFTARGPRLGSGLWMVGDSIFPGQSTAAVALGGLRVAEDVLRGAPQELAQALSDKTRRDAAQTPFVNQAQLKSE